MRNAWNLVIRSWRRIAMLSALGAVLVAALVQTGLLLPTFRTSAGMSMSTGPRTTMTNDIQNLSWRPWSVRGIRFGDGRSSERLSNGVVVHVSVLRSVPQLSKIAGKGHRVRNGWVYTTDVPASKASVAAATPPFPGPTARLDVSPAGTFAVAMQYLEPPCSGRLTLSSITQYSIVADIQVDTSLGTRSVPTTFNTGMCHG